MTEAEILRSTYEHRAKVVRPMPQTDGLWDDYSPTIVYNDLLCAVSFTGTGIQGRTDTVQEIVYVAVLFADPDVVIFPGDEISVNLQGIEREFIAGESAPYSSHIEVPLIRKAVA